MKMKSTKVALLRVKIKSLAAEARIIRCEEERSPHLWYELNRHRRFDVREEQRLSLLAYAFLRGRVYATVEQCNSDRRVDWQRVGVMVAKFGRRKMQGDETPAEFLVAKDAELAPFKTWIAEAKASWKPKPKVERVRRERKTREEIESATGRKLCPVR